MRKKLIYLSVLILIIGCSRAYKEDKSVLARINDYQITKEEFEQEFKDSSFGRVDTPESRREFLNNLINRKLILQDAQERAWDKDKSFLKMIERFWEQSLLKTALDKKAKEIAGSASVSDKSIEEVYNKMVSEGNTDKTYDKMYNQIKWELTKFQESQAMSKWVSDLRRKARITINSELLK
ncbi:MAG: SurA N-terminal domain-containing protein [Candidatus Omnitrophica bacterium]|nr:SurA N-terminal domain-containing protein [Candidatus Omnitrophota bacterium]